MAGQNLIENLALLTGLPYESVSRELIRLVESHGKCPNQLSLEETRMILAEYLQDVLLSAKVEYERNFEGKDPA